MTITEEHRETIRVLATATRATRTKPTPAVLNDFRATMRASREKWGSEVHEYLKACALSSEQGGQA